MSLVEHAEREMKTAGLVTDDFPNGEVLELVRAFAGQGHSGSSALWTLDVFGKLARFQPLTPLTADPAEWVDQSEASGGEPTWQSRRRPDAFSTDGGKTYYLLDEEPREIHTSEPPHVRGEN